MIRVAWPTEDDAGRAVSALEGVPFVRYKGATADYTDECEIKVGQTHFYQSILCILSLKHYSVKHNVEC